MTTLTAQPDTGKQTHGSAGREHARKRAHSAPEGARSAPVQRDMICASAPGQRVETKAPAVKISRSQLAALNDFQKIGYERVGLSEQVKKCGTIPVINGSVGLGISEAGGVQCCGLARCGSRWCPDCWGIIAKKRAQEIHQVAEWAHGAGHRIVLCTLTAAHVDSRTWEEIRAEYPDLDEHQQMQKALRAQDLTRLFHSLRTAWRKMNSGRNGKALKAGRVGYARSFEITLDPLGANVLTGSHGHYHVLIVLDGSTDFDQYEEDIWRSWSSACKKVGLETSRSGFDFKLLRIKNKRDIKSAATYLVKGEKLDSERVGLEMTSSATKTNNSKGRTSPEGLLRAIGSLTGEGWETLRSRAFAHWRAIEEATKGHRWLTWSRDLRKDAGLGEEKTDEELAQEETPVEGDNLAVCAWSEVRDYLPQWREVIAQTKKQDKWRTLLTLLDTWGIDYRITDYREFLKTMSEHRATLHKTRPRMFDY